MFNRASFLKKIKKEPIAVKQTMQNTINDHHPVN